MSTVSAKGLACSQVEHSIAATLNAIQQVVKEENVLQLPENCTVELHSQEQEDALFDITRTSTAKSYLKSIDAAFNMVHAQVTNPSRQSQVLGNVVELIPQMIAHWHESGLSLNKEAMPQAAIVCKVFKVIVGQAQLKKTTLNTLIASLLSVVRVMLPDYVGGDSTQCNQWEIPEDRPCCWRESLDRGATGSVLVDIITVLTDFEKRRVKAKMPSTAATHHPAVPTIMVIMGSLTAFPDHQRALSECLTDYANGLFAVSSVAKQGLKHEELAVMLSAWSHCCLHILDIYVHEDCALLAADTEGEILALAARPIIAVYKFIAEPSSWMIDTHFTLGFYALHLTTLPRALQLWKCIRAYQHDIFEKPYGQYCQRDKTAGLLQPCDTKLISAVSSNVTTTLVMAKGTAPHLLASILNILLDWADNVAPWGSEEDSLAIAGIPVTGALHSIVKFLDKEHEDHGPSILYTAARCAAMMLLEIAATTGEFSTLVGNLVLLLEKILNKVYIAPFFLTEVFEDNELVQTLWILLDDSTVMEGGSTRAVTEAYVQAICRLITLLCDMMPCLVARVLTLGEGDEDSMYHWSVIDMSLKRALGSSYHDSTAKRHVAKVGRRLAETKKICKCWENWGRGSRACSDTKLFAGVRAIYANQYSNVRPEDLEKVDAAMASLLREEAASEAAVKAKAAKSKTTTTSSTSTKFASSGPSNTDLGVSNMALPASPVISIPGGDAAIADVVSDAASPPGRPQSAQTDSAQRTAAYQAVTQHPAVRARLAQMASADAAMASLLLEEAALEAAANNKAAKMARKRARKKASKAAASDSKGADSPATSMASAASEEQASDPRPHGPNAAPSGAGDTDVADDESLSTCRPGQSESRRTKYADWMLCPITQELFRDPVVCTDGFSYERAAGVAWLKNNDTSYVTGERLSSKDIVPNLALRSRLSVVNSLHSGRWADKGSKP